jgi:cytochrome P450
MEQRKLMLPAFHGERMARLEDLVAAVAEREIAAWPDEGPVALHPLLQRLTLEIILRAVFGLDPGPRLERLRELLGRMLAFGDRPVSLIPPPPDGKLYWLLERVGPFASFVRIQRQADALIHEVIDEHSGGGDDVLSMLLQARHEDGSPMSGEELRDELMTMLVAGHETTASSLAWAFERLCRSPAVLQRLTDEIEEDDYLTATIQEALRRRPVLPNVAPRYVVKPYEVGGILYPEGVCLVPNAYLLHHDPTLYPDPYAFRPERFLGNPPGTYTWIPFGGGRRRCLGSSFAMLEMKLVLRAVLRARVPQPAEQAAELVRRRNITIRPGRGSLTRLPLRSPRPVAVTP